ncbi:MAG: two pore domain potassium channel family protein, partial [Methanolinea sp.]|nr:two pore domain potassium channel family protein [Methanolinea sp.]
YEQGKRQEKTDMLVGLFFSSLGTGLLREFARKDPDRNSLAPIVLETQSAGPGEFSRLLSGLDSRTFRLDARDFDLPAFRDTLGQNVQFLLLLLQNPDLIEHDRFSDLLFATIHLWDELMNRDILSGLPDPDLTHLSVDINRIYAAMLKVWVVYLRQIKKRYPFLHSLALRTNPFDDSAEVIIRT